MPYEFTEFVNDHKSQLISSDIPEYFWYYLFYKLNEEIYDIGDICELQLNDDKSEVLCAVNKDLKASDGTNIFLIDNAWTFEMDKVKLQLKAMDSLRDRVASMLSLETEGASADDVVDAIMDNLWTHVRYYDVTLKIPEERKKLWYILDEVGSCINHSEHPTVRIVPFIFVPRATCYSVAWLIDDVQPGDLLSVNRVEHIIDPYLRTCISHVWTGVVPTESSSLVTMSAEFFQSHKSDETRPDMSVVNLGRISNDRPLRVYTDVAFVRQSLSDPRFEMTESRDQADILWLFDHFRDYESLSQNSPRTLVNQFPAEMSLTTKDLLAALGTGSDWSVDTFNMRTELAQFIAHHHDDVALIGDKLERIATSQQCLCNCHLLSVDCGVCSDDKSVPCGLIKAEVGPVWIVKPWNLARGIGIFISPNIDYILRMVEAYPNEPKIASRYITDPVLFYRADLGANVKFDIRYMVLLSSVEPLRAFTTKVFWLRFANKQFVLTNWDDYETHFTVMNYKADCELKNIGCEEFQVMFDQQYPNNKWSNIEALIHQMLRNLLEDVTRRPDPFRVHPSPQSRAMYAVDLMLEWTNDNTTENGPARIAPRVCEVNYCPDCTRACKYHPNFFNDVFSTLFLDDPAGVVELLPATRPVNE